MDHDWYPLGWLKLSCWEPPCRDRLAMPATGSGQDTMVCVPNVSSVSISRKNST